MEAKFAYVSVILVFFASITLLREKFPSIRYLIDQSWQYVYLEWTNFAIPISYAILISFFAYFIVPFFWNPLIINNTTPMLKQAGRKKFGKTPPVYPNGWFKVFISSELKRGEVKYLEVLGLNLVFFRGKENGQVQCMWAYCPHLGANLGVWGTVVKDCIQCPFHGWCFDGDGKCVSIPYIEERIPSNANTKSFKVHEENGVIWLHYDAEGREPSWYPPHIPGIEDRTGRYKFIGHEIPENGADLMHLPSLHKDAATLGFLLKHKWDGGWEALTAPEEYKARMWVVQQLTVFGIGIPGTTVKTEITQIGPGLVYLSFDFLFGKMWIIETQTPLEPFLQSLDVVSYVDWRIPCWLGKFAIYGFLSQFNKDLPIWNNKTFASKPVLVKKENLILQYRRWYSQFYSEHSPTPNSLDW